jgi:hypothetical protein
MGAKLWVGGLWMMALFFTTATFADDGAVYRGRYSLSSAAQKLVDNHGDGFEPLYGTRNVRAVLNGVMYRGGANNAYHRTHSRNNQNPLPDDGLLNLCQEGFSTAIYLYTTNYNGAPHSVDCTMRGGGANRLEYRQLSIISASNAEIHDFLQLVMSRLTDNSSGPIYAHCWNGWHASGLISAYTLRQFCGFSGEQAVAYWNQNTDGNDGSSYEGLRSKIRAFVPYGDLALSQSQKSIICPKPGNLSF